MTLGVNSGMDLGVDSGMTSGVNSGVDSVDLGMNFGIRCWSHESLVQIGEG